MNVFIAVSITQNVATANTETCYFPQSTPLHSSLVQGSRDGAMVSTLTSLQCGPGSIPGLGVICGLSLLLVLVLVPRGFSLGTPVFPSPKRPTFLNSNLICQLSLIVLRTFIFLVFSTPFHSTLLYAWLQFSSLSALYSTPLCCILS